jgi:CHAD domain-containing protein
MKARKVKKLDPKGPLAENAARIVQVRVDELRSFVPAALHEDCMIEQHDMRIAAKRLRYILETTEFCFGRAGPTARRRAKDLQDVLGELHDCDEMLPRVEHHLAELRLAARAPHRTAYRGLEVLAVYVEARRRLLFERFRAFWDEQERAGTWERLERAAELRIARQEAGKPG